MILQGVSIKQGGACTVSKHQTVSGCTVVIGGGEALIVHTAGTARSDNYGLSACDLDLLSFHVKQNRACCSTLLILDDLNGRGKVNYGDLTVLYLVTKHAHDLGTRVVLAGVHTLAGGTAAVGGYHGAVSLFVKHNAEVIEPLNADGRVVYQLLNKLGHVLEVTAAHNVKVVLCRAVVGLVSCLDTALCHHGVCITVTELGHDHHVCAVLVCHDSCSRAGAATTDNQHVNVVINLAKVNILGVHTGIALQNLCKLKRNLFTLVGADCKLSKLRCNIVGVVLHLDLNLFLSRHTAGMNTCFYVCKALSTRCLHLFDGF